jgi:predicted DNA-binding WGR domain protein
MSGRRFQFVAGSSKKFWAIELVGNFHAVHFGRIGTDGRSQIKGFASPEEAKKSYEKLIAEKVKKGYVEVGRRDSSTAPAVPPQKTTAAPRTKPATSNTQPAQEPAAPQSKPGLSVPSITHVIDIEPTDWLWATWRKRQQQLKPEPRPFDLQNCLKRFTALPMDYWPTWEKTEIPDSLSPQEAHFWFAAMTAYYKHLESAQTPSDLRTQDLVPDLASLPFTGHLTPEEIRSTIQDNGRMLVPVLMVVLAHLLPLGELTDLLADDVCGWSRENNYFFSGLLTRVLPYLSDAEIGSMRDRVRPRLDPPEKLRHCFLTWEPELRNTANHVHLAACLGVHEELGCLVTSWPDDFFMLPHMPTVLNSAHEGNWCAQNVIFGLGDARAVEAHLRRLHLGLNMPEHIRAWLAHTECKALGLVRDAVLTAGKDGRKEDAAKLLEAFALVKAPEAAPYMLELQLTSKAPAIARQWLDEQVGNAIAGLIPTEAARGKLAEAALEYLRTAKRKGHAAFIETCLASQPAEIADKVRRDVLEHGEMVVEPLDARTTPAWLMAAAKDLKTGKVPAWVDVAGLPAIRVGERRLSAAQVALVIAALQRTMLDQRAPLLDELRQHAALDTLDAFAWRLFERWLAEGAHSKDKWAMGALGYLGGDSCALKLTPLVRAWPGESQHQRAVFGLECLRAIGSDTALMQLNGIAQKLKFKALKQKALAFMEAIARDKGMTRAQLEDRIAPDCDLDERGSRLFDFGPRKFRFVLGPGMKPMVKDEEDNVKPDLPKPGTKDDAKLAEQAVADWKLLKKQIGEVAKIQAVRLEQAMVTGRRWPLKDFETLLVRHPLMTNLVRLVVWGGYDKKGKLACTFRVTEDQGYADARDQAYKLQGIDTVGIVHPLHLSEADRRAWGEVLGDYEIIPPFAQLGRQIYPLEKDEKKQKDISRFNKVALPAPTLVFGLEKFGWVRGLAMDAGCFDEHSKPFPSANVTAVVNYEGNVGMGCISLDESLTITGCHFVPGQRGPAGYEPDKKKVALGNVDPVVISEVLTDLTALAAKAK